MTDRRPKARGLGRGLSALMSDVVSERDAEGQARPRRPDLTVPAELLHPNPDQPRRSFAAEALSELAASIREKGIIQPLIVRADPGQPGHYQIVAGERRWRAAQIAQLHDIPVLVRELDDTEVLEIAIIENIQRADLNAIDEAAAYRQLMDRFGHTQEHLAQALGKSRSHIANLLRLLSLPPEVQDHLAQGRLSAGHARTLVGLDHAGALAAQIIRRGLSVREAERLSQQAKSPTAARKTMSARDKDADTISLERELAAALGLGVSIEHDAGQESGRLILRYRDLAQLDDLLRVLSGG